MDQESRLPSEEEELREPSVIIIQVLLRLQHAVVLGISRARRRLLQGFTVISIVLLLLFVAAFLYGTFYYSYMPKAAFSAPVYYYYRTDCESPSSFWCSYPVANVSLMKNKKHVLTFGQAYRVYLQLEMPDSPTNHEVGMFMIKTTCFSQDGGQVASSARTATQLQKASSSRFGMLRYRSDLLKTLGTVLFLPAFLTGAAEQKQVVEVELFSEFTDDPYAPSVTALVEILSSKVQIYSSHLYVHAHFTGLREANNDIREKLVKLSSAFLKAQKDQRSKCGFNEEVNYFFNLTQVIIAFMFATEWQKQRKAFHFKSWPAFTMIGTDDEFVRSLSRITAADALVGVASNFTFLSLLFILSYMSQLLKLGQKPEQLTTDGHKPEGNGVTNEPLEEKDPSADAAERLGPLQTDPTDLSEDDRHLQFCNNTDRQNGHALNQGVPNQSEAA